ncbi:MAG: hypothetical protein JWM09_1543 [Francisellaceae bacterium]|nr:hypothetical protein [Francisellaceae bacterium]
MDAVFTLKNKFLIAMPGLTDPNFYRSVIYICEHNESRAIGLIINRALRSRLTEILTKLSLNIDKCILHNSLVLCGGPIHTDRGFVIHSPESKWDSTICLTPDIGITTSLDILKAIAQGKGPAQIQFALGYASWLPGQLEQEIKENVWLVGPSSKDIIFKTPLSHRWRAAAALMGINIDMISFEVGHS